MGKTFTRLTRASLVTGVWCILSGLSRPETQENKQKTSRQGPFLVCARVGLHEALVIVPSEVNRGISKPRGFPYFSGKVLIVSRIFSGMLHAGPPNRPSKRKRTNRGNPRKIRKNPEKNRSSLKAGKGKSGVCRALLGVVWECGFGPCTGQDGRQTHLQGGPQVRGCPASSHAQCGRGEICCECQGHHRCCR